VAPEPDWDDPRYGKGQLIAMQMYKERGIEVSFYKDDGSSNLWVFYNIGCAAGEIHSIVSHDKFKQYIDYHKDRLNEKGENISDYEVDLELSVVIFHGLEKKSYLYFKSNVVDDFIHRRER